MLCFGSPNKNRWHCFGNESQVDLREMIAAWRGGLGWYKRTSTSDCTQAACIKAIRDQGVADNGRGYRFLQGTKFWEASSEKSWG